MQRQQQLQNAKNTAKYSVLVIGGGATGLGVAVDAASRGFSTLLVERADFAKGTSSKSTKLVHGGVRYLAQGYVDLVKEALKERGRLAQNASHLFRTQPFIIPGEKWWTAYFYTFGLTIYDKLAGSLGIGKTRYLKKSLAQSKLLGVKASKLKNAVCYYDGQFDDARLAINLAQTAINQGANVLNYCEVISLLKDSNGKIIGATLRDNLDPTNIFDVKADCVINATGIFTNEINLMNDPKAEKIIVPSQGVHIVLDKSFLPGEHALMVPKTSDGRVLFAVPWHNKVLVGTTDTLVNEVTYEPKPLDEEINFILQTASEYFIKTPTKQDILSVFVGLRPLAAPKNNQSTKEVSRSHKITIANSGLVDIIGGKWTTYRQMAEDTLDMAIKAKLLPHKTCVTANLAIHGSDYDKIKYPASHLNCYGSDRFLIEQIIADNPETAEKLHQNYDFTVAQVIWAVKNEMAQTLEDVLARRMRLLFLDARVAKEVAPKVAQIIAKELNQNIEWQNQQIAQFQALCDQYYF